VRPLIDRQQTHPRRRDGVRRRADKGVVASYIRELAEGA
jgi:hypothetical protein